ncbi:MFS multidrug transporter-like protein [Mollisia scopiformis]|uniref:MFS multidrug transporter-like protein n=1 Tax=Mollisia scopiformis TaxID=149040 RepID=A0A194XSJ1_MOLSC|nr:MFS multidrug transporter-like protein [Mollisia scopiformis]KUJ23270.1 MFS multidrug transporter-like protein [Mollisia scopiformis]
MPNSIDKETGPGAARTEHLETIRTVSRVPGNTHYYEKDGLRTYGDDEDHDHEPPMTMHRLMSLIAMAFLWTGSQIPVYLFGGIPPYIYRDIGGTDRWVWFVLGNLLALAAVCPFVGALSDLMGRRYVAMTGASFIVIGMIVCSTAHTMNTFIAGMAIAGAGAGINELTALAATSELAPTAKRGKYVAVLIFTIIPFCPSVLWGQLIAYHSTWRYVGLFCALWAFIGLVMTAIFYFPPPRVNSTGLSRREIISQIDFVGGFLSIVGIILFIAGLLWGGYQYKWHSAHVLVPLILGAVFLIAFGFWEVYGAKYPMFPSRLKKDPRILALTLVITFISGANFFSVLLFWPTQAFNVYGHDPVGVGIRGMPIGFSILVGACIVLWLLSVFRGGNRWLMIISSCMMTAGCGALAAARLDNLKAVYGILVVAGLGIGGIVVPASIITTIICPDDLIATVAALTLAIRVVGGAIGYTTYYNVFLNKFVPKLSLNLYLAAVEHGIYDIATVTEIGELTGASLLNEILLLPGVDGNVTIWNALVIAGQESYAYAYPYVYYTSIAFGAVAIIASVFLGDISKYMDDHVAVVMH